MEHILIDFFEDREGQIPEFVCGKLDKMIQEVFSIGTISSIILFIQQMSVRVCYVPRIIVDRDNSQRTKRESLLS